MAPPPQEGAANPAALVTWPPRRAASVFFGFFLSRNLRAALRAGGIPSENGPRKGPAGRPRALAGTAPSPAGGGL